MFKPPLPLRVETPPAWAQAALRDPEGLLSDHAHCEKKAALSALSIIHLYPSHTRMAVLLARLAEEELNHFRRVLEGLQRFGMALRPDPGDAYVQGLVAFSKRTKPPSREGQLADRLFIGALIEARSSERLHLLEAAVRLHPELAEAQWPEFLFELERCEAGHALTYLNLAQEFAGEGFEARLEAWLDHEAELVRAQPWTSAVH